ncbi:MAG: non-homologous end joining protein Ku, partial [Candidatus Thorarchaeota archaeon]
MPRAINSSAITMGLVTVPVKVYTAASTKKVSFCQLSADGHRVKQQWISAQTEEVVQRSDFKRGFEYVKGKKGQAGKSVEISDEELDTLGPADPSKAIEIKEFVSADAFPALAVEKTDYLGPGEAGEGGYSLFTSIMRDRNVVALAKWTVRGREQLVAIRPHKDGVSGLVLQQLFYSDEIRDYSEIGVTDGTIAAATSNAAMLDMAGQFIDAMTSDVYDANKYQNEYAAKVLALVEKKINGDTIDVSAPSIPK